MEEQGRNCGEAGCDDSWWTIFHTVGDDDSKKEEELKEGALPIPRISEDVAVLVKEPRPGK